jgi:hypothetical protein
VSVFPSGLFRNDLERQKIALDLEGNVTLGLAETEITSQVLYHRKVMGAHAADGRNDYCARRSMF